MSDDLKAFYDPQDDEDRERLTGQIDDIEEEIREGDDPDRLAELRAQLADLNDGLTDDTRFRVQDLMRRIDQMSGKSIFNITPWDPTPGGPRLSNEAQATGALDEIERQLSESNGMALSSVVPMLQDIADRFPNLAARAEELIQQIQDGGKSVRRFGAHFLYGKA